MDARAALNRSVSTGLHLARGTADRVVRLAGPPLGKVAGSVIARVRGSEQPATPATFTPSKRPAKPTAEPLRADQGHEAHAGRRGPQHRAAAPDRHPTQEARQAQERPGRQAPAAAAQHVIVTA